MKNTHAHTAFSFVNFLKIQLKCVLHLEGNLSRDNFRESQIKKCKSIYPLPHVFVSTLYTVNYVTVFSPFFCFVFSAWLEEEDDPVIERVNQRIEAITGLTVDTAELLQVMYCNTPYRII